MKGGKAILGAADKLVGVLFDHGSIAGGTMAKLGSIDYFRIQNVTGTGIAMNMQVLLHRNGR